MPSFMAGVAGQGRTMSDLEARNAELAGVGARMQGRAGAFGEADIGLCGHSSKAAVGWDPTGRYFQKMAISPGPNTPHNRTLYWGIFPVLGAFILVSHTPA